MINNITSEVKSDSMDMIEEIALLFLGGLERVLSVPTVEKQKKQRDKPTDTIKIMASSSLESSLHALLSSGLPTGTNVNPAGGVLSFVILYSNFFFFSLFS